MDKSNLTMTVLPVPNAAAFGTPTAFKLNRVIVSPGKTPPKSPYRVKTPKAPKKANQFRRITALKEDTAMEDVFP